MTKPTLFLYQITASVKEENLRGILDHERWIKTPGYRSFVSCIVAPDPDSARLWITAKMGIFDNVLISDPIQLPLDAIISDVTDLTPLVKDTPSVTLWIEGFSASDNNGKAAYLGAYSANTLEEAVDQWLNEDPQRRSDFNTENMTHWGRHFFDNEADATKAFG